MSFGTEYERIYRELEELHRKEIEAPLLEHIDLITDFAVKMVLKYCPELVTLETTQEEFDKFVLEIINE